LIIVLSILRLTSSDYPFDILIYLINFSYGDAMDNC